MHCIQKRHQRTKRPYLIATQELLSITNLFFLYIFITSWKKKKGLAEERWFFSLPVSITYKKNFLDVLEKGKIQNEVKIHKETVKKTWSKKANCLVKACNIDLLALVLVLLLIFWGNGTGILPQMDEWSKTNPRALHDFRYSTKKWSDCSFAHWVAVTLIWIEWCHVKQLYRRKSPPDIGAKRWADNTSTMSKRRMSFSLSFLQKSYTVSFGYDFARNSINSLPAVSWLCSRESIWWSSIVYLLASFFQVGVPGFFLVRRFPTFSWISRSTSLRHLSSKSKETKGEWQCFPK